MLDPTTEALAGDPEGAPRVAVVMGSASDWPTMRRAAETLGEFGVAHESLVVSAHRMPDEMFAFAESARDRGLRAIIAGAGGAAHLPGMLAAKTIVPVLGVPVPSKHLGGQDSLYSIVQMPAGVPVATFAIGEAGAVNAALFAVALLAWRRLPAARSIGTTLPGGGQQAFGEAETDGQLEVVARGAHRGAHHRAVELDRHRLLDDQCVGAAGRAGRGHPPHEHSLSASASHVVHARGSGHWAAGHRSVGRTPVATSGTRTRLNTRLGKALLDSRGPTIDTP